MKRFYGPPCITDQLRKFCNDLLYTGKGNEGIYDQIIEAFGGKQTCVQYYFNKIAERILLQITDSTVKMGAFNPLVLRPTYSFLSCFLGADWHIHQSPYTFDLSSGMKGKL